MQLHFILRGRKKRLGAFNHVPGTICAFNDVAVAIARSAEGHERTELVRVLLSA